MSPIIPRAAVVLAGAFLVACAAAAPPSTELGTRDTTLGTVLVDARGMTLYTYTADTAGVSNCGMLCRQYWPPAYAADAARPSGDLTLIDLDDGRRQWAYKDLPLYTYVEDDVPGDVTGQAVDGEWYVVSP